MRDGYKMLPLLAAAAFSAAMSAASPARACQCPSGPGGGVSWPADGATDVATDTPIVVQLIDSTGDPGKVGIALTDEAGTEIALNETARVPPSWKGCGAAEAVFLRPARQLDEGVEYTVWISPGATRLPGATFTVGAHAFEPEPAIPAIVTYAAHYPTRACL
ncbi:MAG TPA: Ig-like domain-containing protein, partial [Polyangiales bacterium]|nr:Ig-like domain-containing protein [Polyangiales bacterium]